MKRSRITQWPNLNSMNEAPKGLIDVQEVLRYLATDRYMDKTETTDYLSICVRNLENRLTEIPHFREGTKTCKRSELDSWTERHRENAEALDLDRLADEVAMEVLRKEKR